MAVNQQKKGGVSYLKNTPFSPPEHPKRSPPVPRTRRSICHPHRLLKGLNIPNCASPRMINLLSSTLCVAVETVGSKNRPLILSLGQNSLLISAGKNTFIVECGSLTIHLSGAPRAISSLLNIPAACILVRHGEQCTVV